ncbi:hypothetical protein [Prevotella sp.]|uniref:hypothetical protein n=1 Tax=Prevotella sp. TaxID=59823 RepID=UPI0025DECD65|nr:hypothetical protein [Prevotella sp.]MCI7370800.1 hypothetical protein [Prevotella sp.]
MKKLSSFFLMGTVALAGLGVMSSCSSDDLGNDSTTNPGETKAVKTQFALNIPRANGGTRMSGDNAQANKNFRGMEDIRMYSFKGEPTASSTSTATFTLAGIASGISETASSKIYSDVSVPVGTTHFLFYAHAPQGTTDADKFAKGVLTFTAPTTDATATSGISAALATVKKNDTDSPKALLGILNGVAGVEGWATETDGTELNKLYAKYTSAKAGSANSIRLTLQSLYNNLGGIVTGANTGAQIVAKAIRTKIEESFNKTTGTDGYVTLAYKKGSPYSTYPNNINLPDGAVQLSFDATNKFTYAATSNLTGIQNLNASKICFPASIYYFQSSDLAATAKELETNQWPTTTTNWTAATAPWLNDASNLADGWTASVQPTTRSIAMRQNINYGVANLATTVKCGAASLPDNTGLTVTDPSEFAGTVAVPEAGFSVTGLLIGGQPTKVGFDFQPTSNDAFDYTIYDKELTGIVAKNGVASTTNYTIVLPNDKGRGVADQNKVNVAIELTNNSGVAFRGQDGIIPDGGKFYLVGQLNPDAKTIEGVINPAVFMSDYKTTMNLTITSLKNAYNTIPDLRSTKLQLGLSVDLDWQAGLQFDVEIK